MVSCILIFRPIFLLSDSRSELLGCMSFGVSNIMTTEIGGWFRLLAESIGRSRHFAVRTPGGARTQRAAGTGVCAGTWRVGSNMH